MDEAGRRWVGLGLLLIALGGVGALADRRTGWVEPAFDAVAHQFYEVPALATLRRPSQLPLVRMHLAIVVALAAAGCLAAPWIGTHGQRWWAVFVAGYAIRAVCWIAGGNLPLVPGDSCHYLEVARSVYRGEGPVKHYVESYFRDYRDQGFNVGRGILDDWATPLWAYVLAGAYRLAGVVPGRQLEPMVAVAKGASFALNLLCLPALYGFARRSYGREVGLGAMALLAVLPVHAIYAGFALRESLVALTSILAVWWLTESWQARGRAAWGWAIAAGGAGGLAVLARNTAMAMLAAAGLYGLIVHGRRRPGPMLAWALVAAAVAAPWAWATMEVYGSPFYTYTDYFQYNFSWTVHHFAKGNTSPGEFYTAANAPTIVRVKIKAILIIAVYSTMILGLPTVLALRWRLTRPGTRDADRLAAAIGAAFVLGTLARVADVTQVAQLGRYYLPAFALAMPAAAAGLRGWLADRTRPGAGPALAATLIALLWADPTWAYDASWFVKPYQLHWPALRAAADWADDHPEAVPPGSRVLTWFPWEFRVASDRATVLLPRNYAAPTIDEAMRRYDVTHVLWGSFEPPPHVDPESWGPYLEGVRLALGLTEERLLYRSPPGAPYPVRLYWLGWRSRGEAGRVSSD